MHGLDDALRPGFLGLAHDGLATNEAVPVMGDNGVVHGEDLVRCAGRDVERAGSEQDDGRRRRSVGHDVAITLHNVNRCPHHDVVHVASLDVVDVARLDYARVDASLDAGDGVVGVLLLHGLGVDLLAVGTAARRLDALRATALRCALLDDDATLSAARRRLDAVRVERVLLLLLAAARAAGALVHVSHDRIRDRLDLLLLGRVLVFVRLGVLVEPVERLVDRVLDLLLVISRQFVGDALLVVVERVLHVVQVRLEAVARVDALLDLFVLVGVLLGLADHALDVLLGEAALLGRDRDLLGLARALVLGGHLEDAVRVDLERHLDLRHAARRRRDAGQFKLSEEVIVLRHRPLALEDLDQHGRLVVLVRREGLRLLRRDDRVAADELRHHAADRLDTLREGRHVQEK
mmetsp:Transcript_7488/g.19656  ORF Transcript_7488/g.19656 Transcript_7488/m.19656 type:complete len:406 (+) Transcript_7488:1665-2882(+)